MTTNTFFPDNKFFPPVRASVILCGIALDSLHTRVTGKMQLCRPGRGGEGLPLIPAREGRRDLINRCGEKGPGATPRETPGARAVAPYFIDILLIAEKDN
jgi:hypothetical protein